VARKNAIRVRLQKLIEENAERLKEPDDSQEQAEERALSAMIAPEEVGKALKRKYSLGWLILSRVAGVLIAVLGVIILLTLPMYGTVFDQLKAQLDPVHARFPSAVNRDAGYTIYPVNIKVPIGNDVVSIYEVGLKENLDGETGEVSIATCNYDSKLFGIAARDLVDAVTVETDAGMLEDIDGKGGSSAGASHWVISRFQVQRTETVVYLWYEHFGACFRVSVPLEWEVLE
jgi:hypothetical protein